LYEEDEDPITIPESGEKKIPLFFTITFILVIVWGLWALYAYWDGASGAVDRGYWKPLQEAANTTFQKESTL